jgi:tetratricopeptide (TPR) repeat protein
MLPHLTSAESSLMANTPVVIVSSTARDLPEYRAQVMDACLRMDMFPKMMEHLPSLDADAIRASLDLVDQADVYVGIFAHRYGYIPEGHDKSVTQMEYERAVERGIPILLFLMHEDVPVLPTDYDRGEAAQKLEKFKDRLKKDRVLSFFKSPEHLRGLVLHSLSDMRRKLAPPPRDALETSSNTTPAGSSIHYISDIPVAPEPYIAHPYTLLRVRGLIGRQEQLELLTDWVTGKGNLSDVRIFSIVAIGGMGKSALTWSWFNHVAHQEMSPLAGRVWWSFYESDATYENFITRCLAYVSGHPRDQVRRLSDVEKERQLLRILNQQPFLLVLDGLERLLVAYAQADSAYLFDEEARDQANGNYLVGTRGLTISTGRLLVGRHKLRKTADPRVGRFLQELTRVSASRILVSTRLYPADLQQPMGAPLPGCFALFLSGLSDRDALALWRAYDAKGSREEMLPVFGTFENHPLLLQLLAYEVAEFRDAPGDFDAWRKANPEFNPFGLSLTNVQSHVLDYALRGLSTAELRTLYVIAGFRMPANMETLRTLLIRTEPSEDDAKRPFSTLGELDAALTALEDRGLLGWDRRSNRYDLHPIVRGVVWTALDDASRMSVDGALRTHFEAVPTPHYLEVESLDDLTPAIELYNTLIRQKLYNDAAQVFQDRLDEATHFRLSASRLRVELLEALLPKGEDANLLKPETLSFVLNALALAYNLGGRPGAAVPLLKRADEIDLREKDRQARVIGLGNLADALRLTGHLRDAETAARTALVLSREVGTPVLEAASLLHVGLVSTARGQLDDADAAFQRALRIFEREGLWFSESWVNAYLADVALKRGDAATADVLANRAWKMSKVLRNERELIHAARVQAIVALELGESLFPAERLDQALPRARAASLVEEELPILIALADWHQRQGERKEAEAMLNDVWDGADEGPYPLFQADALNLAARIHQDAGDKHNAAKAATRAYVLAWCDGPPFAYNFGLEASKRRLAELGAREPVMSQFTESQYVPGPTVEIDPPDESAAEVTE